MVLWIIMLIVFVYFGWRYFFSGAFYLLPNIDVLVEYSKNYEPEKQILFSGENRWGECFLTQKKDVPKPVLRVLQHHSRSDYRFKKSIVVIFLKLYNCQIEYSGLSSGFTDNLQDFLFVNPLYKAYMDILGDLRSDYVTTGDVLIFLSLSENKEYLLDKDIEILLKETFTLYSTRGIESEYHSLLRIQEE